MPLYIKDDNVAALAEEYQHLIGAKTKTDAVRHALKTLTEAEKRSAPLSERISHIQRTVNDLGETNTVIGQRSSSNELWERK